MFPLKKRKIGGYKFGEKTFYNTKHTGTDYEANYVNYYAPFSGYASAGKGTQGGIWWTLTKADGTKFTARHLSKLMKTGQVKEGDLVAVTGNTGTLTTHPHLHQEVYINGKLTDPEKFNWGKGNMSYYIERPSPTDPTKTEIGIATDYGEQTVITWASDPAWGDQLTQHYNPQGIYQIVSKI